MLEMPVVVFRLEAFRLNVFMLEMLVVVFSRDFIR